MGLGSRLASVQVLRFAAASGVVTAHTFGVFAELKHRPIDIWSGPLNQAGVIGVDIFFVVSGFVIFGVAFGKSSVSPVTFIVNRVERIVPVYLLATLVWIPVAWSKDMLHWRNLFTTLTFWPAIDKLSAPIAEVGWTLCFEMLFYAAICLILIQKKYALGILLIFAAAWWGRDLTGWPVFRFIGNPIILEFLAGILIAKLWMRFGAQPLIGTGLLAAGILIYMWICRVGYGAAHDGHLVFDGSASAFRVVIFGVPAALIVFGAMQSETLFSSSAGRRLAYLGDTSYSLYLIHIPVLFAVGRAAIMCQLLGAWYLVVLPLVCVALGIGCHEWVEVPLTKFVRQRAIVSRALCLKWSFRQPA